jgi:hypothetical protein
MKFPKKKSHEEQAMIEFANMENRRNLHIEEKKRREGDKKELKEEANKRLEYIDAG